MTDSASFMKDCGKVAGYFMDGLKKVWSDSTLRLAEHVLPTYQNQRIVFRVDGTDRTFTIGSGHTLDDLIHGEAATEVRNAVGGIITHRETKAVGLPVGSDYWAHYSGSGLPSQESSRNNALENLAQQRKLIYPQTYTDWLNPATNRQNKVPLPQQIRRLGELVVYGKNHSNQQIHTDAQVAQDALEGWFSDSDDGATRRFHQVVQPFHRYTNTNDPSITVSAGSGHTIPTLPNSRKIYGENNRVITYVGPYQQNLWKQHTNVSTGEVEAAATEALETSAIQMGPGAKALAKSLLDNIDNRPPASEVETTALNDVVAAINTVPPARGGFGNTRQKVSKLPDIISRVIQRAENSSNQLKLFNDKTPEVERKRELVSNLAIISDFCRWDKYDRLLGLDVEKIRTHMFKRDKNSQRVAVNLISFTKVLENPHLLEMLRGIDKPNTAVIRTRNAYFQVINEAVTTPDAGHETEKAYYRAIEQQYLS